MTDKPITPAYTESNINYLEPMKHVRLRPGMYVGGTDVRALHHLIYEVVDNSIDEALAGRCDTIVVTLHDNNYVSIMDNGVGIPVGIHPERGMSTLQMVMTLIGAGAKFDNSAYKVSGGLHGVGVSAVNALSAQLIAQVRREGYLWQQVYSAGEPTTEVERIRPLEAGEPTGTIITFQPDYTILEPNEFSYSTLAQRFREMSFVTRKVTITLRDERVKPIARETTYYFEGGLRSFVKYLNRNRNIFHEPVYAEREVEYVPELNNKKPYTVGVEFAFQYNDSAAITELAFANTINTPDGGAHLTGMRSAITGVINRYARKAGLLKEKDPNFSGSDTLEGIVAIVSVKHPMPSFESQTKVKLINPEVQGLVSQVVTEAFNEFLEVNSREARRIVEKCMTSMRAREAARKARDLVRSGPSLLESTTLPGKLADCSKHGEGSEIYIVEGDSAGGCFAGDTRVALVDGRNLSFEELVKEQAEGKTHFCYTIRRDGTIGIEQVLHARVTKHNAEVIRLTLDNGEQIVCTPDHRFMLRDGSYKAAADLSNQDSLMPLYPEMLELEHIEAPVAAYNHRISAMQRLDERIDVYDIEVPVTHNFALASGVFVHNSAKQGRDRHFQAILPLRGKILNTERARLDKMLDNNEIKALIAALGTGISEDMDVNKLRYDRIIIMSVAGDEPTLVKNHEGTAEFVRIGDFIDQCMAGSRNPHDYQVMCFDLNTHQTRFRPLKAVIRHSHEEPLYRITTRHNRSIKVTSSHSVFVYENGEVVLKKGSDIRPGDLLVSSRKLPRPESYPTHIDLLTTFYEAGLTDNLYVRGESVRQIAAQRVLAGVERPDLWKEPRVELSPDCWKSLSEKRQSEKLSLKKVADAVGVKQSITILQWERGEYRPILPQFEGYLDTIGWNQPLDYTVIPSKIDEQLAQDDSSRNARWRQVSSYKLLGEFTGEEFDQLGDEIQLVPRAHMDKSFGRYLSMTRDLVWLLGWYVAEGTMSQHQVSINLGEKDERFIPEITAAVENCFGETPRLYRDPNSKGIKLYFHSVAAARLLQAWGIDKPAHEKKLPDVIFSLPEEMQIAFVEAYFLGDGTTAGPNISFTTNSPDLKDGLLYLLGQLGIIATHSQHQPATSADAPIQTRRDYYIITIGEKQQLEMSRAIWQRHANAPLIDINISRPKRKSLSFTPISDDLMGLKVLSVEEIEPVGDYVYDFSVQDDENFICGTGGICAHNTDADVDGSHIRTLLLTFFFRHMQPIISEGHLYIAQPPIFRLQHNKDVQYIYNQPGLTENDLLMRGLQGFKEPDRVKVSRYKGLGEMNPDQLWETTMDPGTRTLLQVTIDDAAEADRVFDMLMGSSVPPRRRFIQTHAKSVRNLDV